jgi:Helix-turn-helix of DDE superfamily endonuclease
MDKYALLLQKPSRCKKIFGMEYALLENILQKVQKCFDELKQANPLSNRGLKSELSFENQFLLTLEYLKSYPTFEVLGFSYGISESYACRIYHKFRPVLAQVTGLKNPDKLTYKKVKNIIVDVAAQPIERPAKEQQKAYNGQKKGI